MARWNIDCSQTVFIQFVIWSILHSPIALFGWELQKGIASIRIRADVSMQAGTHCV